MVDVIDESVGGGNMCPTVLVCFWQKMTFCCPAIRYCECFLLVDSYSSALITAVQCIQMN